MTQTTAKEDLLRGIWRDNPTLVQVLGMCPTLATTNTVATAFTMGVATLAVLVCSGFMVSLVRRIVPNEVRIATYILIIATFVTLADMTIAAIAPGISKALGPFVALIVANCLLLGRAEAFAARNPVWRSTLDGLGNGLGFTFMLTSLGIVRELLGYGTFLGHHVFGARFEPWVFFAMPPGGFLALGLFMLTLNWLRERRDLRRARPALHEAA